MMHDEESCEFETVMLATPDDLVMQGIYKHIAISLCGAPRRRRRSLLAFKDLPKVRAPPKPPRKRRRAPEAEA